MQRLVMAVLFTSAVIACKGKDKEAAPSSAPTSSAPAGKVAPAPHAAAAVDICSFATKEQIETAVAGKATAEPAAQPAQGSFLGGCNYQTDGGMVSVSGRPATEWDGTVAATGEMTDVAGVGEKAVSSPKVGVFVKPAGKSYFLHVMVVGGGGLDVAKATEVAKVVTAGAK